MTMIRSGTKKFPEADSGYFHLTDDGWIRKDHHPFPSDRLETWSYEMESGSDVDKEIVHLTRVWSANEQKHADLLRERYGDAITPSHERHIILDCDG
jgi:hypothetical protein